MFCALLGKDIRLAFTGPLVLWSTISKFVCLSLNEIKFDFRAANITTSRFHLL